MGMNKASAVPRVPSSEELEAARRNYPTYTHFDGTFARPVEFGAGIEPPAEPEADPQSPQYDPLKVVKRRIDT